MIVYGVVLSDFGKSISETLTGGPPCPSCGRFGQETWKPCKCFFRYGEIQDGDYEVRLHVCPPSLCRCSVHALAIGIDLALHRCLPFIVAKCLSGGADVPSAAQQWVGIKGGRTWLALCKTRYELAYNLGRPVFPFSDEQLHLGRQFVCHPLTTLEDCRLLSACELLTYRLPLYMPFRQNPFQSIPDLDAKVREANRLTDKWFEYWDNFYQSRGLPTDHIIRSTIHHEHCHAILHTNSKVLYGIKKREDLAHQSAERRCWLSAALQAAQKLMRITLHQEYQYNFRYGNHYTHVAMVFAARYLIRLARLLPDEVDLRQTGRDVEALASRLNEGFSHGQTLQQVLGKARKERVIPPRTRQSSPDPIPPLGTDRRSDVF